jgi:polysaccharide export outer membrane protein
MRWPRLLLALIFVPLAACAVNSRSAVITTAHMPYTLDAGDVLAVTVYGDESLSKSFRVDDSGAISFPLVGPVTVRGRTPAAAASAIAAALTHGFMRNPSVTAQIESYRPIYVQGAVKTGGQFAYVPGMSVRAAVSTAGGYSETADSGHATLYRKDGDVTVKSTVKPDFPVYPGDTIVIAERWL